MRKPIIGIAARELNDPAYGIPAQGVCSAYVSSVVAAGGIPVVFALTEISHEAAIDYVRVADGILFAGGEDIDPQRYNAAPHPRLGKVSSNRDQLEFEIFTAARAAQKPMLGICRGLQFINVALGGTLYQDLPSEAPSNCQHTKNQQRWLELPHSVDVEPGTLLADAVGSGRKVVNTLHHQAIKDLGKELRIVSRCSEDGVIEGIEGTGKTWLLAVQWHPEVLWPLAGSEWNLGLFKTLVQQATPR